MLDNGPRQTETLPAIESSRALVVVDRRRKKRSIPQPSADFVMQLIAAKQRLGQYRRTTRDDPDSGLSHYRRDRASPPPAFELKV